MVRSTATRTFSQLKQSQLVCGPQFEFLVWSQGGGGGGGGGVNRHLYVAMSSFPFPHRALSRRFGNWSAYWRACSSGMWMCCKQTLQSEHTWEMIMNLHLTPPNHNPMQWLKVDHFYLSSTLFHSCSIVQSFETIVSTFAQQSRNETFNFMTETILFVAELVSLIATILRRDL